MVFNPYKNLKQLSNDNQMEYFKVIVCCKLLCILIED